MILAFKQCLHSSGSNDRKEQHLLNDKEGWSLDIWNDCILVLAGLLLKISEKYRIFGR